jgi:hypothetical protein
LGTIGCEKVRSFLLFWVLKEPYKAQAGLYILCQHENDIEHNDHWEHDGQALGGVDADDYHDRHDDEVERDVAHKLRRAATSDIPTQCISDDRKHNGRHFVLRH